LLQGFDWIIKINLKKIRLLKNLLFKFVNTYFFVMIIIRSRIMAQNLFYDLFTPLIVKTITTESGLYFYIDFKNSD